MSPDACDVYIWIPSDGVGGWYLMEFDKCDGCLRHVGLLAPRDHDGPALLVSHQCLPADPGPSR